METLIIIISLGCLCQLLAWKFRLPSILLLLVSGFLFGDGWLQLIDQSLIPDEFLFPCVSIAVAIILFEGGLDLKLGEIHELRTVIIKLISVGVLISWGVAAVAASYLFDCSPSFSLLIGAILTVSGPTVVIPLLQDLRVSSTVNRVLKWEGILVDPVGAIVAVLTFEALYLGAEGGSTLMIVFYVLKTVFIGCLLAFLAASLVATVLKRRAIPEHLENPFVLMTVLLVNYVSNVVQHESGLLSVTLMGVILANSKKISFHHIAEFKENLRILLISWLFIVIASRISIAELSLANVEATLWFVAILILLARPLSVFASTIHSSLSVKERIFVACVYPRGIVAAAVATLFGFKLLELADLKNNAQYATEGLLLLPTVFMVIVATVTFYSLAGGLVARLLGLTLTEPEGVLFVGASPVVRELAIQLKEEGMAVALVDTNYGNVSDAHFDYLPATHGDILSPRLRNQLDLTGIGKLFAMTPNQRSNTLSCIRWSQFFGRNNVFQLSSGHKTEDDHRNHTEGRVLFGASVTFDYLKELYARGARVKVTALTDRFSYEDYLAHYESRCTPLCYLTPDQELHVFVEEATDNPKAGARVVSLVQELPPKPEA